MPWDYEKIARQYLREDSNILDYDTGGGEFLLSLNHKTSAAEGFEPNVQLCRERLLPMGIKFKEWSIPSKIPYDNESFDMIINRHGDFDAKELGAFVWFARIIEWEFPDFTVDKCFEQLLKMHEMIEDKGKVEGTIHRYLIAAMK